MIAPIVRRRSHGWPVIELDRCDGRGSRAVIGVGRPRRSGRHAQLGVRLCVSPFMVGAQWRV
jgi:hypothetical protein